MGYRKIVVSLVLALALAAASLPALAEQGGSDTPLVVAYSAFSEKFSPFFADTAYDVDVKDMTQVLLIVTDRVGGIVYNAIEGETREYGGTDYEYRGIADLDVDYDEEADITTYTAKLRDDIVFSDGEPLTADDLIFTYYVFLDPAYVGSTTLNSYPIIGLKDYQTQTTSDVYAKYEALADGIFEASPDHVHAEEDAWTAEQQDDFWARLKSNWIADVQSIVDYVYANYLSLAPRYTGYSIEEITADEEHLKVTVGMALWGFGQMKYEYDGAKLAGLLSTAEGETVLVEDVKNLLAKKTLVGAGTGTEWDLTAGEYPTLEDFYQEVYVSYEGNPAAYTQAEESPNSTDVFGDVKSQFIGYWGPMDEAMAGQGVPNIAGIKKLDDYSVEVKTNGYEAPAVYTILGIEITPLHYYGDPDQYDYENDQFGFPFGDLSTVEAKTTQPMGAGPYKFVKYENRVVYFEANEHFYKGAPKIKHIQFKETASAEVASGVNTGVVDAGELSGTKANFAMIAGFNANGEISGDRITTSKVDNLGYGYIGINADTVNVGGEPGSAASKNLRKGLATVLAIYREVAYDSYYGEAAAVINYPISNTSWAAPQPTDEDYKVAFSVDVEGKDIYLSGMSAEEKYAAALDAAKGYFLAAGYTLDEETGKFTQAPEGARLAYEVIIPGDGTGDHPSFAVLTEAKGALENLGITLEINDPADSNILWQALDAGEQDLWTAAWGATIDPDMYQVYHSSNIVGLGGSDSNHYHIADPELDRFIIDARKSDDQAYRKAIYKQALDVIVDWAVEIPAYQRQNCTVFSTERMNIETITPDITTYWGWMHDIELLEMN